MFRDDPPYMQAVSMLVVDCGVGISQAWRHTPDDFEMIMGLKYALHKRTNRQWDKVKMLELEEHVARKQKEKAEALRHARR